MLNFHFTYDLGISLEQMVGFEMAAALWSHYFTDDITINLHIVSADTLGDNGEAVGGAIPLFHEVEYGVFREYYQDDIASDNDTQAHGSLDDGNTVNLMINGKLVDGNTNMLVTSAQAKALAMDQPLLLDNGTTWERDLVDPNALDGYIVVNQSFDWDYDFARVHDASDNTLDFFSMAVHEIGHQLGFVSGIDGTLDVLQLHSGETRIEDFTILDLFRHTIDSGTVSDVTLGENAYFSLDNGVTNIADFSTGNQENNYQASHWKRFQTAIGVMDPTLAYKERLSLTELDLQAFDVLGYNIDATKIGESLDLSGLLQQAQSNVSLNLGVDLASLSEGSGDTQELYKIGYSRWWKLFEKQIHELGYSRWWDVFEQGMEYWDDELNGTLELGYSRWWQLFEEKMIALEEELISLDLGYSRWWQEFQQDMLDLGYSRWWEVFELGYSRWWQKLDNYFSKLEETNGEETSIIDQILNPTPPEETTQTISGGDQDDIIGGVLGKDLISGLKGDDLIDGKSGADIIMGDEGDDMIYGLDGDDVIYGGQGDDFIAGETDNDQLYGEEGHDVISGGAGNDFLSGGQGKDVLKGDQGQDVLMGGTEDDVLEGGDDNDLLLGEQGKDLLDGGAGDDILRGDGYSTPVDPVNNEPDIESLQAEIGISTPSPSPDGVNYWLRLEAESLKMINFHQKIDSLASGDEVVVTGGRGKVRTNFTGAEGTYDIVVSYYDSSNGQGELTLKIGEQEIDSWTLNQDSNGFVTRMIQGVNLNYWDRIELGGRATDNELIKIDYLDIISVDNGSAYDYNLLTSGNQINLVQGNKELQADSFRLEAEAMTLSNGYQMETDNESYSGNANIFSTVDGQRASASYIFTGNSGVYNIFASYVDGINGEAKAQLKINGRDIKSWEFKADSGLAEYNLVGLKVGINQGDVIELIGEADGNDFAKIDYLDFKPVLTQQLDSENDITADYIQQGTEVAGRVEAEMITLGGANYKIESKDFASGGQVVKSDDSNTGMTANTTFNGSTGFYNIVFGYYDGNDGIAEYTATVNGIQQLDHWQANLDLGNKDPKAQTFVSRTLARKVLLNPGDEIELQAIRGGNDKAYIDYLEFVEYDPTAAIRIEAEYMNASGDYKLEEYAFASAGRVLRSEKSDDLANALKLNTPFTGESGQYSVVVHYFDENDGQAQLSASLGGVNLDSWLSNQDLGDHDPAQQIATSRIVATNIEINTGDVFELSSIRNSGDYGRIDSVEFIPYTPSNILEQNAIQLEIEDMDLTGEKVKVKEKNFAYGGAYVETSNGEIGLTASTLFMGEEGYYDIVLGYYDSNKGEASVTVKLNEDELNSWVLNQDFGTDKTGVDSFTTYTVAQGVYLEKTDTVQIIGLENNGDKVNLDYIKLIPVEAPTATVETQAISNSDNGDILRGGAGNDQIFGDEGDDLLYGENEYDTPNSSTAGDDTLVGGSGDDVLYGNSGDDFLYGDGADSTDTEAGTTITPATLTFQQGVNGYSGTVDTFIHGGTLDANNSTAGSLNIDGDNDGNPVQSLIRFEDIFGTQAGQIALDDTINSAILEINVSGEGSSIELYEMLQSWSDTDTWNTLGNGIQADGAEAGLNPIATTGSVATGTLTIDVTASLQAWQANPTANQGWVLLPTGTNGVDFDSAEGSIAPRLIVDVNGSGETIKVEAEDMTLSGGYFIEANSEASGGELLRNESTGTASLSFSGADGLYDVVIHYVDENDGNASIAFNVNGIERDSWVLNENTSTTSFVHTSRTISGVNLSTFDSIEFVGTAEASEYTRIDYVEFISVNSTGSNSNLPDGLVYNGHLYFQTDSQMSWQEAQNYAESLGGNLVTINDAAENQWLKDTFGTTEALWIGFSDAETEGTWKWSSGEVPDWILGADNTGIYADWAPTQPDDHNNLNQDYAILSHIWDPNTDQWDDVQSGPLFRGIIEIKLSDTDSIATTEGNDILTGNSGNDNLFGGGGNDTLNGTDMVSLGINEQDMLTGGNGADTFILGNANNAYYLDINGNDYIGPVEEYFATVTDFDSTVDSLQLHGNMSKYTQTLQGDDLSLFYEGNLVAVLQNQSSTLNLDSSSVSFMSNV